MLVSALQDIFQAAFKTVETMGDMSLQLLCRTITWFMTKNVCCWLCTTIKRDIRSRELGSLKIHIIEVLYWWLATKFSQYDTNTTKELELLAPTAYSINDQLPTKCLGFSTWLEKGVIVSVLIPKPTIAVDKLVRTTKLGSWNAQRQGLKRYLIPGHLSTKFCIHCKNLINYSDSKPQGVNWGLHK